MERVKCKARAVQKCQDVLTIAALVFARDERTAIQIGRWSRVVFWQRDVAEGQHWSVIIRYWPFVIGHSFVIFSRPLPFWCLVPGVAKIPFADANGVAQVIFWFHRRMQVQFR